MIKLFYLAVPTGFEPAISALTGPHVRPLHHGTNFLPNKRAVVYHADNYVSICPVVIKRRICRGETGGIMHIDEVAFVCPVEQPVRVAHR